MFSFDDLSVCGPCILWPLASCGDPLTNKELLGSDRACLQEARGLPKAGENGLGKVFASRPQKHKLIANELGASTMLLEPRSVEGGFLTAHSCEETLAALYGISSPSRCLSSGPRLDVEDPWASISAAGGLAYRRHFPGRTQVRCHRGAPYFELGFPIGHSGGIRDRGASFLAWQALPFHTPVQEMSSVASITLLSTY